MKKILLLMTIFCLLLVGAGCAAPAGDDQPASLEELLATTADSDPLTPVVVTNDAGLLDYTQVDKDASISDGSLRAVANRYIYRQLARYASGYYGNLLNSEPEYTNPCYFSEVEIRALDQAAVYDDLLPEETVYVYHLDYALLPEQAEDVMLRDSMHFDDQGWLADRGLFGSPYLILTAGEAETQYHLITAIAFDPAMPEPLAAQVKVALVDLGLMPATSDTQAAEFSFSVNGRLLTIGLQQGGFPWEYDLTETSRSNGDGDGFHWIDIETAEGLQVSAFRGANDDDTDAYLYSMYTESPDFPTYRGVCCGDSEDKLTEAYGEELTRNEDTYEFDPVLDGVWRVIYFQVADGLVASIKIMEIVD